MKPLRVTAPLRPTLGTHVPQVAALNATQASANEGDRAPRDLREATMAAVPSAVVPIPPGEELPSCPDPAWVAVVMQELQQALPAKSGSLEAVATRLAAEVERICRMSQRIQASDEVAQWQRSLAQHRISKYVTYFKLGSRRGRVELHSTLSAMAYRYIAPPQTALGFEGRCTLLEDFLQGFYIEALKAFRRENQLPKTYSPQTRLELAEYMAFCEQYAKRRITIPGANQQQILILRAQTFARRQPAETSVDIELAMEPSKADEPDGGYRSQAMQQVREQMTTDVEDPADQVLRDRIIQELITYLETQDQQDCVDYFVLRLQDLPASEIDEILNLSARQRDYLQQRFKYHVEKFAQVHHWQLVHQWLGIDLEHNLGLPADGWHQFLAELTSLQQELLLLRREQLQNGLQEMDAIALAQQLNCTPKRVTRTWGQILSLAWKFRNQKKG